MYVHDRVFSDFLLNHNNPVLGWSRQGFVNEAPLQTPYNPNKYSSIQFRDITQKCYGVLYMLCTYIYIVKVVFIIVFNTCIYRVLTTVAVKKKQSQENKVKKIKSVGRTRDTDRDTLLEFFFYVFYFSFLINFVIFNRYHHNTTTHKHVRIIALSS